MGVDEKCTFACEHLTEMLDLDKFLLRSNYDTLQSKQVTCEQIKSNRRLAKDLFQYFSRKYDDIFWQKFGSMVVI